MRYLFSLLVSGFLIVSLDVRAEELKLKTPRGVEVEVTVDVPSAGGTKLPAIVIAPGGGYHKELPILKQFAQKAADQGFIVFRFNWNYFSTDPEHGEPSENLKFEIEDMRTVINYAKGDRRVDGNRLLLAGKSLGTMVSYSIFASDKVFPGLLLFTPVCTDSKTGKPVGDESYPNFAAQTKPIAMILGNSDSLCALPALYDFVRNAKGNVSTAVFAGGHSLTFGALDDPKNAKRDAANIEAAVNTAVQWANIILEK